MYSKCLHFKGAVVKIDENLQDVEAFENDTVTLRATTSNPVESQFVVWLKDRKKINNDRYQIEVNEDGIRHSLVITDLAIEDNGEFSIEIKTGKRDLLVSSCKVTVHGK